MKLDPAQIRRLLIATFGFWLPIGAFIALALEVREPHPSGFDVSILQYLHEAASPLLNQAALGLTQLGGPLFIVVVTGLLVAGLAYRKYYTQAVFVMLAAGGNVAVNVVLKSLFQRDRPSLWQSIATEHSYSFPSGHATASSALAFVVVLLLWRTRWRWVALVSGAFYVVLVGLTRVYLGVHYPTDILAGWCVSLAWVLAVHWIIWNQILPRHETFRSGRIARAEREKG